MASYSGECFCGAVGITMTGIYASENLKAALLLGVQDYSNHSVDQSCSDSSAISHLCSHCLSCHVHRGHVEQHDETAVCILLAQVWPRKSSFQTALPRCALTSSYYSPNACATHPPSTGTAMAEIICHCKMCRRYHSNSLVPYVLFPYKHAEYTPEDSTLQITKGEDNLSHYTNSKVQRSFCKTCSAPVFNIRPDMGFVATFPCMLTTYDFKPAMHVHYGSKIMSITDGELPCL
jgi:hypothetical protein